MQTTTKTCTPCHTYIFDPPRVGQSQTHYIYKASCITLQYIQTRKHMLLVTYKMFIKVLITHCLPFAEIIKHITIYKLACAKRPSNMDAQPQYVYGRVVISEKPLLV